VAGTLVIVVMLLLGSVIPAAAQHQQEPSGRAQALSSARDQKSEERSAPRRSLIERGLHWYDRHGLRLGWRALHFTGGSFPQGAGFGYGIGATSKAIGSPVVDDHLPNRVDGDVFAARSLRGYQRAGAQLDLKNTGGRPIDVTLRWLGYRSPQEDFYGLGAGSSKHQRTSYRVDGHEFGAGMTWRASESVALGGEVAYLAAAVGEGTDARFAKTQARFDDASAPGLSDLPTFVRASVGVGYDWRDSRTHPRRGGHYRAAVAAYRGVDDPAFDFRRVDVSAQQTVPLPNRYRRIELRAAAALTDAGAGRNVPFIHQPTLGGTHLLRGFAESRFRDRNAVWASAEYQWEAWWALDGAIFVDAGQVAAHRARLSLDRFEVSYGIGFRLHSDDNFMARLDIARSREGIHPILGFRYGF
jgi:hypothetical protein